LAVGGAVILLSPAPAGVVDLDINFMLDAMGAATCKDSVCPTSFGPMVVTDNADSSLTYRVWCHRDRGTILFSI
jgi:hypothetical protein